MTSTIKYIFNSIVTTIFIVFFFSCNNKKNNLECVYPNNPIPLRAAFVGFFDYDLEEVIFTQYAKNGKFDEIIRSDTYHYNPFPVIKYDTSVMFLDLGNKVDYEIIVPKMDTFKITEIVFEDEQKVEIIDAKECPHKTFDQYAQSAKINGVKTEPVMRNDQNAFIYLINSK